MALSGETASLAVGKVQRRGWCIELASSWEVPRKLGYSILREDDMSGCLIGGRSGMHFTDWEEKLG